MSTDDLGFDAGKFTYRVPVYVCLANDTGDPLGGAVAGGGRFLAFFTDEDLAWRYITALKAPAGTAKIADEQAFRDALVAARTAGFTHVVFDHSGAGDEAGHVFSIDQILQGLAGG
jgi:hypothetical protein